MNKSKNTKYESKRNLNESPEPTWSSESSENPSKNENRFVIQLHNATQKHYDFRLEIDGVLKSWVIPKGPSTDTREKRLAIRTEDHPIEYKNFEGVIPEGNYGAGTVLIWDKGTYSLKQKENEDENTSIPSTTEQLKDGHIFFELSGKKLQGGYALTRFRNESDQEHWLLVKSNDEYADARRNPTSSEPESVKSGKTLKQIAEVHSQKYN